MAGLSGSAGFHVGVASVRIVPSFQGFRQSVQSEVGGSMAAAGSTAEREGRATGERYQGGVRSSLKGLAEVVGAAYAVDKVAEFFKESISAGKESIIANQQLEARLKSTKDAVGLNAEELGKLAEHQAQATATTKTYQQGIENLLLTFTNVRGEIFQRALPAINDVAAAMHESGQSAAVQLGKALNDPVRGLTALQRIGITFSDTQKKQIQTWVKHGQTAKAQGLIIQEIEKEMGGAAAAAVTPAERFHAAIENLQEEIGEKLYPVVAKLADAASKYLVPALSALFDGMFSSGNQERLHGFLGAFQSLGETVRTTVVQGFNIAKEAIGGFLAGFQGKQATGGLAVAFQQIGQIVRPVVDWLIKNRGYMADTAKALIAIWVAVKVGDTIGAVGGKVREVATAIRGLASASAAFASTNAATGGIAGSLASLRVAASATGTQIALLPTRFGLAGLAVKRFGASVGLALKSLATNPIVLIIAAVVALGVAFYEAYKHFKPFHDFVNSGLREIGRVAQSAYHNAILPAFNGIRAAGVLLWDKGLKPILSAFVSAGRTLGSTFVKLWHQDLGPALAGIKKAALDLWNNGIKPAWNQITRAFSGLFGGSTKKNIDGFNSKVHTIGSEASKTGGIFSTAIGIIVKLIKFVVAVITTEIKIAVAIIRVLATVIGWLAKNIVVPMITVIAKIITWLVKNVIAPMIAFGIGVIKALATIVTWLAKNVVAPMFAFIVKTITFFFKNVLSPMINLGIGTIKTFAGWVHWLYDHAIHPVWNAITSVTGQLKKDFVKAFDDIKSGVGRIWSGIKKIVADPVNFVINDVYDGGIRRIWNDTAAKIGLLPLGHIDPIKLQRGGVVPGGWGGGDRIPALLEPGERVLSIPQVLKLGGHNMIDAMVGQARPEVHAGVVHAKGGLGGLISDLNPVNWAKKAFHFVAKVGDWGLNQLKGIAQNVIFDMASPVLNGFKGWVDHHVPAKPPWAHMPAAVVDTVVPKILSLFKSQQAAALSFGNYASAGPISIFDGVKLDQITIDALKRAWGIAGFSWGLTQGSYNAGGVAASAGTHDGGGAIDVNIGGFSFKQLVSIVHALRQAGFAAWHRTTAEGFSGDHIHAELLGDPAASPGAKAQWTDYMHHLSGLAGHGQDTDPVDVAAGWPAAPSINTASSGAKDYRGWARALLSGLGFPQSNANLRFVYDWALSEGGPMSNPLNVGIYSSSTAQPNQSVGAGLAATVRAINQGYYSGIRAALASSNYDEAAHALWYSPWAASHYGYGSRWATSAYAAGTGSARAGWAVVGEKGPELIRLNGGEEIMSNRMSTAMASGFPGFAYGTPNMRKVWENHKTALQHNRRAYGTSARGNALLAAYTQLLNTGADPEYTIQHGDTLSALGHLFDISLHDIEAMNPQIHNPNLIFSGQKIHLIPKNLRVKAGGTSSKPVTQKPPTKVGNVHVHTHLAGEVIDTRIYSIMSDHDRSLYLGAEAAFGAGG